MHNIQVFSSSESAFYVNSFIIETTNGLALVDTQFLNSSARQLRDAIRARGKPLLGIFITHPHPDHFNGAAEIVRDWPGVPIYATQATIDVIRSTEADKRAAWTPVYGEDYPKVTAIPDTVALPGQRIGIDGLELYVDDLGEGESADITVVHLPQSGALIASDLLYHGVHPWLAEGRTAQWLAQLETVRSRYADVSVVYAGHGPKGGLAALAQQRDYLIGFRDLVRQEIADRRHPLPEEEARIIAKMSARYPDYPLQMLVKMNIGGVARELAEEEVSLAA